MDPPLIPSSSSSPPLLSPNPNPNSTSLPTTISLLRDLTLLAESTLQSLSPFLPTSTSTPALSPCPFDSRHRIPPSSLFRHYLSCPSAPGRPLPSDLGLALGFHSTLNPQSQAPFLLPKPDADLCFSLDEHVADLGSNFFYKDCPGVVATPEPDSASKTFTLPPFLSVECANFASDSKVRVLEGESEKIPRILPSEFWSLKCEVEAWRDRPVSYSYAVLRVIASDLGSVPGLKKWVLSNSVKFGIVIDSAMGEHVVLLLRLCLKAIRKEAVDLLKGVLSGDSVFLDVKGLRFECPRLGGSLMWLAAQLAVLYGDVNGKLFAIGMVKEALLHVGSSLMVFKVGEEECRGNGLGDTTEALEVENASEDCGCGQIFVSQVAAAIAALHERLFLEERIKTLRFSQPLPRPQLINEYIHASTRACEIREKRPNYRPVLEHDGLLWQRANNQDSGKPKTREELLAEERDYKRRRMSYRGKKVKRNLTQVLRDIIEDHMEEIKRAGGIGCNVKATGNTVVLTSEGKTQSEIATRDHELRSSGYDTSETRRDSLRYRTPQHTECDVTSKVRGDISSIHRSSMIRDLENPQQKPRYEHSYGEDGRKNKHEREKDYASRSPPFHKSHAYSREQYTHRKEQDYVEVHNAKYARKSSGNFSRYKDHISRSDFMPAAAGEVTEEGYDSVSESRNRKRGRNHGNFGLESVTRDAFGDRYDPSSSSDVCSTTYDDVSVGRNYDRLDKHHRPSNDAKYHYEQYGHDRSRNKHD